MQNNENKRRQALLDILHAQSESTLERYIKGYHDLYKDIDTYADKVEALFEQTEKQEG